MNMNVSRQTDDNHSRGGEWAQEHRRASLEHWQEAASGWKARADLLRRFTMPVSAAMIEAIEPQPGQRILELAAGIGDTGFAAAELIAPTGTLICSDQSEAMIDAARERAAELSVGNVELRVLNAEWIDLPLTSVDAVLCRWGYMLMADPAAALAETRRVLRPGGRLALAVWDAIERNPWAALPSVELVGRDLVEPPAPGTPGPFALGDSAKVQALVQEAGFSEVTVEAIDIEHRTSGFEEFWETTLDLSRVFHDTVLARPQEEIEEIRSGLRARLQPYVQEDGSLDLPARTLMASATA